MIKKIIKKILNYFNLKIVKINVHKPLKHPYPVPTKEEIELIQTSKAICALLGDKTKIKIPFYVSNNDGACSSIIKIFFFIKISLAVILLTGPEFKIDYLLYIHDLSFITSKINYEI